MQIVFLVHGFVRRIAAAEDVDKFFFAVLNLLDLLARHRLEALKFVFLSDQSLRLKLCYACPRNWVLFRRGGIWIH